MKLSCLVSVALGSTVAPPGKKRDSLKNINRKFYFQIYNSRREAILPIPRDFPSLLWKCRADESLRLWMLLLESWWSTIEWYHDRSLSSWRKGYALLWIYKGKATRYLTFFFSFNAFYLLGQTFELDSLSLTLIRFFENCLWNLIFHLKSQIFFISMN